MLLSYDHRFIFIHNYRVAGTSIRKSLEKYVKRPLLRRIFKEMGVGNNLSHHKWKTFPAHIKASDLRKRLPAEIYDSFYKFAFVRNPWDWQVSLYHYMCQNKNHHQHEIVKKLSFCEYVDWRVNYDIKYQKDFIFDDNGIQLVDYVGKIESLQADFNNICDRIKVPKTILSIRNQSIHQHYKKYYSEDSKHKIETAFKEDIELFGYSFNE